MSGAGQVAQDRVVTHVIVDPAHGNMPASAFDYPLGWQAESQLVWNMANGNGLVLVFARAFDPSGPEMWQLFPSQDCFALANGFAGGGVGPDPFAEFGRMLGGLFGGSRGAAAPLVGTPPSGFAPPGPRHIRLGGLAFGPENAPPMPPLEALPRFVIPKFRGHLPGLRILGVRPAPGLAAQLGFRDVASVPNDGAVARIAYLLNGTQIEEEFLCGGYCLAPNGGQQNWGLKPIMSFRAAAGALDGLIQRVAWIAQSIRGNPQFEAMVAQIGAQIHAGQQAAMMMGRRDLMATQAREMDQRAAYFDWRQETQAAQQAQSWQSFNNRVEGFGDAMMGRTAYVDPSSWTGQPHYDYGHHAHVWTDGRGNFQHADDANYDPNVGSDRNWTLARRPVNR